MKKIYILFVLVVLQLVPQTLFAHSESQRKLTRKEFRDKQKEFIIKNVGLTPQEALKFFPLYYELQDLKQDLNNDSWDLIKQGKQDNLSDEQYEKILKKLASNKIECERLDSIYIDKFSEVLPYKKYFYVKKAEIWFRRDFLRKLHYKKRHDKKSK